MISGYRAALAEGATVIAKIDGHGQMDPRILDRFIDPILSGKADYIKRNRFFDIELVASMPSPVLHTFASAKPMVWSQSAQLNVV